MASGIIEVVVGELAGAVVGKLGEMAVNQVAYQASLLLHFRNDLEWLKNEFTKIKGYLQHEHDQNGSVKKWFADVKDIALDAEDMIQECAVQPLYCDDSLSKVRRGVKNLKERYTMGRKIRKLKERMDSLMKDLADLNLVRQVWEDRQFLTSCDRAEEWKKSGMVEIDATPVAIDAKVEQILHMLEDDARHVIAVVGMGGIGKTFLMQNVYNHLQEQKRFQKAIWLSISQVYSVARLQYDIASYLDLKKDVEGVSEQRAAELIHQRLKDQSCLIVMDDVWRVQGVNLIQRLGIPVGSGTSKPCKVMVTTRSLEVCNILRASVYHMELLSEEYSWNLFCLRAFPDDHQNRPPQELNEVAHEVERGCSGLPLAIKTVAASMASQKQESSWKSKLQQLREVGHLEDPIEHILWFSWDALPAVLKPCFLFLSFFGEDVKIDAEYLIYLWIAEGFIPKVKERMSIGWSYLKQLHNLCLVEVSEDEDLKSTCKIHDLLLDLIIRISKENKCAFKVDEAAAVGCRRMLLAKKGLDDAAITGFKCPPSLRTLSMAENSIGELPTKSLKGVRAMRVMDLSYTNISVLPQCVRNFKLLRVLNLSRAEFEELPECVRHLKSLWFLSADTCPLPEWIGDFKCLQHLHVDRVENSREISRGISKLVSLRTLRTRRWNELVLKDFCKLIQLEEVSIRIQNEEDERNVEEGVLAQLVNMRRLTIQAYLLECTRLPEKMKAMKDLQYLHLHGFVVPRWMSEYGNLRVLKLQRCELSEWAAVETMPNLIKMDIEMCRGCKELGESCGKSGAFPHLRYFRIQYCWELEKLAEVEGAMPRVEEFVVKGCSSLQKIPEGFEHLRSLKLLDLSYENGFSDEERERLKEGGEYWNKIKANNPHVTIRI